MAAMLLLATGVVHGRQAWVERLPTDVLDVRAPSERVQGAPGSMRMLDRSCRGPAASDLRRRIVDISVQEWGYFGFPVLDQTAPPEPRGSWRTRPRPDPDESERVAATIAGYWAATPDGRWILDRQNEIWRGSWGAGARWRDPWSAAYVSWVMCEAGLGQGGRFRRAIAHHTYIDQAIAARDSGDPEAAFVAFDVGERPIEPGDLLCVARRPAYKSLEERRAQSGVGMRSHCDVVVKLDTANDRILVIGGNVRGAVRLKIHAADFADDAGKVRSVGLGRRTVFAHLKLDAESIADDAFESSPTMRVLADRARLLPDLPVGD